MKVFVIARNLRLNKVDSKVLLDRLVQQDAKGRVLPFCVVETEVLRITQDLEGQAYSYHVRWWEYDTYQSRSSVKEFLARDVFSNKEEAVKKLEERWEELGELVKQNYVWSVDTIYE